MFRYVQSAGWVLFRIAAFSAGSPKASQPIGCSTFSPRCTWYRAIASAMA